MADLVFDVYAPPTENDLGTRLIRITREMYGPGTFYRHTLSGIGSGQIVVERDQSFVTAENFAEGNYVIVRDLDLHPSSDTQNVLGGFVFEQDFLRVIADPGQRVYRFGGPSTIALLARAIMGPESLSPFEGPSSIVDGYWRWGSDTYGGVWRRALFEANLQDPPGLPMVDTAWIGADNIFWNDDDDSNGDAWPLFVGDFRTRCGTDLLTLGFQLFGFGIEHAIDAASFDMYAYNENGYGTDRSSGSFASGKVRFTVGVNIAKTLDRTVRGQLPLTHILVRTTDRPEGTWFTNPAYSPGDPVRKAVYQTGDISGDPAESPAVTARVNRLFSIRKQAEDGVEFYSAKPVNDPLNGGYQAGPNYATGPAVCLNAHYWVGDWITINSGSGEHDYTNATKRIESVTYELTTAADDDDHGWNIIIGVGPRVGSLGTTQMSEPADAVTVPVLCQALIPGEIITGRLYYTEPNDVSSGLTDADYSGSWDFGPDVHGPNRLRATPQSTLTNTSTGINDFEGVNVDAGTYATGLWTARLDELSDLLEAVQSGGTWQTVIRSKNREGIGISESVQFNYPTWTLRVWRPGTSSFIGTIFDLSTSPYRFDISSPSVWPSIPMEAVGAAVPSAVSTDYLVLDLGADHVGPTSGGTGWSYRPADSSADDLPFVVDSVADQNAWLGFSALSAGASGSGLHPDLVGTSVLAARCDHKDHLIRDRSPTADDSAVDGIPAGTLWVQVDDLDAPTAIVAVYRAFDVDGSRVWLLEWSGGGGGGGGDGLLIIEDDTVSDFFSTLRFSGNVLTDNGDGSVTAAVAAAIHSHSPAEPGFHGVSLRRTTDFTTTNTNASIPDFDTVEYDTDGFYDAGDPERITIPAEMDGLMMQFYAMGLWGTGTSGYCEMKLYRNGTAVEAPIAVTQHAPVGSFNVGQELLSRPVQVAEGDYFTITFRTPNSETLVTYDDMSAVFAAWWVGGGGGGGGAEALDDLTDVTITAPAADDDLRYNGSVWINDPRKWEAVTNGEDVFVWEDDDLVHEWNEAP